MESVYVVEPKSRMDLRNLAVAIRKALKLEHCLYFPAVEVLEILHYFDADAHFEVVPFDELGPNTHADTDIVNKVIRIREDVYERACKGNGRDRMTVVHEIAHFMMICICGFKLSRSFNVPVETCRDPEWQAKCLAGELMMDYRLIKGMTATEVADACGVSLDAAEYQLSKI